MKLTPRPRPNPQPRGETGSTKISDPFRLKTKLGVQAIPSILTDILKPKSEITVPKSIRRKAGIKLGDRVEFQSSDRSISIIPKLTPDEEADEGGICDPKIRTEVTKSNEEFSAGESRPTEELFAARAARAGTGSRRKA